MIIKTFKQLFERDLNQLKTELSSYSNEKVIWKTDSNISNSAGNLCLHLLGNLNWFIGAQIGNTGYIRQRELEFSLQDIPVSKILSDIDKIKAVINTSLDLLTLEDLEAEYPIDVFKRKMTTHYFLTHLTTHLAYHLGQINYHRRLLD